MCCERCGLAASSYEVETDDPQYYRRHPKRCARYDFALAQTQVKQDLAETLDALPKVETRKAPHQSQKMNELRAENERLKRWVNDLQAGMFINCVYCGHRYGPDNEVPATMANVLKEHIAVCPRHPLSAAETDAKVLAEAATALLAELTAAGREQSEGSIRAAHELESALSGHDARLR